MKVCCVGFSVSHCPLDSSGSSASRKALNTCVHWPGQDRSHNMHSAVCRSSCIKALHTRPSVADSLAPGRRWAMPFTRVCTRSRPANKAERHGSAAETWSRGACHGISRGGLDSSILGQLDSIASSKALDICVPKANTCFAAQKLLYDHLPCNKNSHLAPHGLSVHACKHKCHTDLAACLPLEWHASHDYGCHRQAMLASRIQSIQCFAKSPPQSGSGPCHMWAARSGRAASMFRPTSCAFPERWARMG